MNLRLFSSVIGITFLLEAISAKTIKSLSNVDANESERIILGKPAAPGQFPFACAVHYNNQFICTCSILSPTTVLTAAHCVDFNGAAEPAEFFYAIANVNRSAPSYRIEFESVTRHPDYNANSIDNDIAIFKTREDIPMNNDVNSVCIARPNTPPMEYKSAIAMGWGKTTDFETFFRLIRQLIPFFPIYRDPNPPERLQYTEQTVVSEEKCSAINPGVNENKICATGFLMGICNGDSGGPLVSQVSDGRYVQIGIASYINGLAGCGRFAPGVWTRTASYYDYIMQTAQDPSICTI